MFLETSEGIMELKEDNTWIKHGIRFHQVADKVFKEDLTTKIMQQVSPSVLLSYDHATGQIEGKQTGFVLDLEMSTPGHPTVGKGYLKLNISDLPVDFESIVPGADGTPDTVTVNYKVGNGGLIKK